MGGVRLFGRRTLKPYKGLVTSYDDEDTQTKWGRKSARRLLKVALSSEVQEALEKSVGHGRHKGVGCPTCYEEFYGRKYPF